MNPYKHSHGNAKDATYHMYVAKTSSAKTPVTVRIYSADGRLKFEETFQRPYTFDPSCR